MVSDKTPRATDLAVCGALHYTMSWASSTSRAELSRNQIHATYQVTAIGTGFRQGSLGRLEPSESVVAHLITHAAGGLIGYTEDFSAARVASLT